ncbi:MAG TPA: hypothetical protein VG722_05080, partial [Tepidisphaeraceae bacterium]|nr:hypothetical protein [Tepidisphaeraceae bacterium]
LKKGQDVEIGFFWSDVDGNKTSGGHWVTVTGINFDTSVGTGTIDLIDPWGGVDITGGNLHLGSDGRLILGYSGGGAGAPTVDGQDPDNPTDSGFGFITGIAAESFVPLPPALWASLVLLGGMVAYRRVRPARA